MLSTFERKIISLLRILYPVKLAQENTGKHTFLYEEHKTPQEIVGGKKFPEWHLADAEDTQTRQNSETQEKDMLRVVTIEIPLGRMLGWAQVLMCACFLSPHADGSPGSLPCSYICLIWVHLFHPQVSSIPEGWRWELVILRSSPLLLTIFLLEVPF